MANSNASALFEEAKRLRRRADEGAKLPIGGRKTKMGVPYPALPKTVKAAEDAYDKLQNLREEEAEMYEDRARAAGVNMSKGGSISASRRGDGIAQRGKTRGRVL